MALATTLSKDEVNRSLKVAMKRPKKSIPPPKYLCVPSSLQIQQKVTTLDENHGVCDHLRRMITSHGCIPELNNLSVSSMKGIYTKQKETSDSTETPKLPLIRRFVVRYLKNKFLENSAHRQFWSFVHIGVNSVLKRLERLDNIVRCDSEQEDPSICCVLLDVGWVKSQLGHHVAHLCAIREVRLVVLRPMQSLAKLTSSSLYPLKKSIAVGISLSNTAPLELRQWIEQVREVVPALTLPMVRPTAPTLPSQPLKRDNPERTDQLHMQSWDSYSVNCAKLYLPSETPISSDRIVTVAELWCRLCSSAKKIGSLQAGAEFFPLLSGSDAHQIPSFGATLVRTVPAQTEEQRHKRKTKKRRLDSSRPPIDSSKKLKKNKEKKSKCKH